MIAIFINKMLNGYETSINGDGKQTRDFVYISDVVDANVLAITNSVSENILNIGTGIEITINQIYHQIKDILNLSIEEHHSPPKQGEQKRSVIDCKKAQKIFIGSQRYRLEMV